jgi:hypothetical protein
VPKGHSTLEPRIIDLERESIAQKAMIGQLADRIVLLERQITAMNDFFSRGSIPNPGYESQFKVMPSAFPITNGS